MTYDDDDPETEAARPVSEDIAHPIHPALVDALGAALARLDDDLLVIGIEQLRMLSTHPEQPEPVGRLMRVWVRMLLAEAVRRKRLLDRLDPERDVDH